MTETSEMSAAPPRPPSAAETRAKVPAEYLHILANWAYDIAQFQALHGNHNTERHAMWMWAVLTSDVEREAAR